MNVAARKPRPRRIAADEAHSWARNLRLGNPYAKLVLCMLTLYVNPDGICFVGIEQLSDDTELSADTVRKRLAWLEHVGAVARFPQWIDGNGRRNGEGKGKRTTDEIRLLTDADIDVIEARALGDGAPISPSCQQGLSEEQDDAGPMVALGQPSDSGEGLTSEPEPEKIPPNPPLGGCTTADVECEGWQEFKTAFEADGDPIVRVSLAQQLFAALSPDERGKCTKAARGLIAHRLRQKKPPSKPSAQTFIREIGAWPTWSEHCPPDPVAVEPPTFVAVGSEEWKALCVLSRIRGEVDPQPRRYPDHGSGLMLPRPLTPAKLALSQFYGSDPATWAIADEHSQQCGSWSEFAHAKPYNVFTGEVIKKETMPGRFVDWKVAKPGLRIPWPWPPRKDGTLCDTAA